jgi:hypothetical protein
MGNRGRDWTLCYAAPRFRDITSLSRIYKGTALTFLYGSHSEPAHPSTFLQKYSQHRLLWQLEDGRYDGWKQRLLLLLCGFDYYEDLRIFFAYRSII